MRGGVLVAVLLVVACGVDRTVDECAPGMTRCAGECVDIQTDPNNCGGCGTVCATDSRCMGGACPGGGHITVCNGVGVDTATDPNNCGQCGNKCDTANGFVCANGTCVCGNGVTDCDGKCVDLQSDPNNCGGCGCSCATYVFCNNGACSCSCSSGMMGCGVKGPPPSYCLSCHCVDPMSDEDNCGACDNKCHTANGFACIAGTCSCAKTNEQDCGGVCVDTSSDPNNCGGCGNVCPGGQSCVNGACT